MRTHPLRLSLIAAAVLATLPGHALAARVDYTVDLGMERNSNVTMAPVDPIEQRYLSSLPARRVTNVTFAGAGLDRMFVTSATVGLEPSAYDGALFEVDAGVGGLPTYRFAG